MECFIQIPKTASNPIDPGVPSFLTILPAEIRNSVYEILFKRDEPVLLHNTEAYHEKCPQEFHMTAYEFKYFHETFESEIGQDEEFRHNLQEGLSLLRSCRQIYHEAAGILYGQNAFIISRALDRHDEDDQYGEGIHDFYNYHQFTYAPRWLSGLGSQIALLKNVVIDMDGSCPSSCELHLDRFNVLPLLRILWKYPEHAHTITFAHTGRKVSHHVNDTNLETRNGGLPQLFTRLFQALVTEDALNLRRCTRHDRLLRAVNVFLPELCGSISHKNSSWIREAESKFAIGPAGDILHIVDRWPKSSFSGLSAQLKQRILCSVFMPAESVVFDLNSRTVHGLEKKILHLYKFTRFVPRVNTVSYKLESRMKLIASHEFDTLKELLPRGSENFFSRLVLENEPESRLVT
jgi:hypothetical protein